MGAQGARAREAETTGRTCLCAASPKRAPASGKPAYSHWGAQLHLLTKGQVTGFCALDTDTGFQTAHEREFFEVTTRPMQTQFPGDTEASAQERCLPTAPHRAREQSAHFSPRFPASTACCLRKGQLSSSGRHWNKSAPERGREVRAGPQENTTGSD